MIKDYYMAHLSTAVMWPNNANGERFSNQTHDVILYWEDGREHKMDMWCGESKEKERD